MYIEFTRTEKLIFDEERMKNWSEDMTPEDIAYCSVHGDKLDIDDIFDKSLFDEVTYKVIDDNGNVTAEGSNQIKKPDYLLG